MEFERGVSGYRPAQVRAFLERISSEREDLLKEVQALRERLEHQAARIEELQQA
jgi:DivIVA domain-containing protein